MTTAFVLSGGGSRGPLEVGALESLFAHGIRPDFFAGTSAGAINSAYMAAAGPDLSNIPALKAAWHKGAKDIVYPGNVFTMIWRVITGADSVFPSTGMRRLIEENMPPAARTFADLQCPCYLTATDLRSGRLYVFGDPEDPSAPLVDAIVASASVPVVQPPVPYHGLQLVDGGVVAATPACVAMDRGATVIYAINVGRGEEVLPPVSGVLNIFLRTIDTWVAQSVFEGVKEAASEPSVELHHIHIAAFSGMSFDDFSHIDQMYEAGKEATDAYLRDPRPNIIMPLRGGGQRPPHVVPGAREFILG
jgi:NTE family protein